MSNFDQNVLDAHAELEAYFEEISAAHSSVHASHHDSSPRSMIDNFGKIIDKVIVGPLNPRGPIDPGRISESY